VKKVILVSLVVFVAVLIFGELSLGINSLVLPSYTINPDASPSIVVIESVDARVAFGLFRGGLTTPFMAFGYSVEDGFNSFMIPPGALWYTYVGGKLPFGKLYAIADVGVLFSVFEGIVPNLALLRIGAGMKLGKHAFSEVSGIILLQNEPDTFGQALSGKMFDVEIGYIF